MKLLSLAGLLLGIALIVLTAILPDVKAHADPGVPTRQHSCITHSGDLEHYVAHSLILWGKYATITDCGSRPLATSAPWPDIQLQCIDNPTNNFKGQTFPYAEYAFIVIYDCKLPVDELQQLVDHEVGHALGLDHSLTPNVLMSPRQDPPAPPHGPFTCEEARRIAALYPPAKSAPCTEPVPLAPSVGDSPPVIYYEDPEIVSAQFATFGKWAKSCLTYSADPTLEALFVQGFAAWSAVANINNCGSSSTPDIVIRLNPLLSGSTVGQASWSISGGIINRCTIEIKLVAWAVVAHELGHCLGLGHSLVTTALMYFSCSNQCGFRTLDPDDIAGIRALYGPSSGGGTPIPGTSTPTLSPTPGGTCVGIQCVTRTPTPQPLPYRLRLPLLARD